MASSEVEIDPYALLEITSDATDQDIKTAYRQRSRKVHPDRNKGDPDANRKFHELNQAYELLLDPLRRMALDAKQRVKKARQERFKSFDNKRKNMVDELEERERAFKKAKLDKQKEETARWHDTEKIKEQNRKMMEDRMREMKDSHVEEHEDSERAKVAEDETIDVPELGSLDTTVKLKFKISSHPDLGTPESISQLLSQFGETDSDLIVVPPKRPADPNKKPQKFGTAVVPFKQIGAAFAAVTASGQSSRGLDGVEIKWAGGEEPDLLGWLKRNGKLGGGASTPAPALVSTLQDGFKAKRSQEQGTTTASGTPFSSFPSTFPDISSPQPPSDDTKLFPPGMDYESLTLLRLRQAERERLERQILEEEATS